VLNGELLLGPDGGTFAGDGLETGLDGLHRTGGVAGHALKYTNCKFFRSCTAIDKNFASHTGPVNDQFYLRHHHTIGTNSSILKTEKC
jgi:hypothetical protein